MTSEAESLAEHVDRLTAQFRMNRGDDIREAPGLTEFWENNQRYADALQLFARILRQKQAVHFLKPVDDDRLVSAGKELFSHVIRTPLCFTDITNALFLEREYHNGDEDDMYEYQFGKVSPRENKFSIEKIKSWNMWNGKELLQAIDLVLVNALAYGKKINEGRSSQRTRTNQLRKILWDGIQAIVNDNGGASNAADRKANFPTKRGENTGFVAWQYIATDS
mmetsp:Transcript_2731/g.5773  ORF Transcript_2731/g.5773 Transcript_2731/m.5773 type:complete len:222 (+) Transcript_2731:503-1168(+)